MADLALTNSAIESVFRSALEECIAQIRSNSKVAGQVATGKTLRSLEWRLEMVGSDWIAQILGRKYFGALETGRGVYQGGKADIKAFNDALVEWMRARGIHSEMNDEQLRLEANRLRWYINRYGTQLYQKGGRKDIFTPAVQGFMETLQQQLIFFFQHEVADMFTKGFQGFGNSELSVQTQ